MTMIDVDSKNVKQIGYDADTEWNLRIRYSPRAEGEKGPLYEYAAVPAAHWDALQTAESVGKYVSQHIVKGGYEYRRVEEEE